MYTEKEIVAFVGITTPETIIKSTPTYFQDEYGNYCYAIALRLLSDRLDAEECVNDTWLGAWNAMPVHRPERLAELIAAGAERALELKRLQLVRHRQGGPVSLIALQFRKGAKPGVHWEELSLRCPDGSPTPAYREIYHI